MCLMSCSIYLTSSGLRTTCALEGALKSNMPGVMFSPVRTFERVTEKPFPSLVANIAFFKL